MWEGTGWRGGRKGHWPTSGLAIRARVTTIVVARMVPRMVWGRKNFQNAASNAPGEVAVYWSRAEL